jgi:hypothetical protein
MNIIELRKALKRAFHLGQTYWQQADSDYASQWKKADQTRAQFDALVEDACVQLAAPQPKAEPLTDEEIEQCMKQAHTKVQGRNLEHAFARAVIAAYRDKQGETK